MVKTVMHMNSLKKYYVDRVALVVYHCLNWG